MSRHCTQGCNAGSKVLDSRPTVTSVRRRRECLSCKTRWTTWETTELTHKTAIYVNKKLEMIVKEAGAANNHLRPRR